MTVLSSTCSSFTGKFLYSDTYAKVSGWVDGSIEDCIIEEKTSTLNKLAAIPFIGSVSGALRVCLACIHMVGHLFAALLFQNWGHIAHVVKGGAELLRGVIEVIPVVGNIFSIFYNQPNFLLIGQQSSCQGGHVEAYSFFLVKIRNPNKLDQIDCECSLFKL